MDERITLLPTEDVYPNPRHYREVRPDAVKKLAASMGVIGQTDPILVRRDGEIYYVESGHHRLAAAHELGLDTIRAIVLDELDDKAAAQLMVAANLHQPETELERSRGAQMMLSVGVRPLDAAAHLAESQDRLSRVQRGLAIAADYAEDMTLERLAALPDLEGDEQATDELLKAPEALWRHVYDRAMRAKRLAAAVADAERVIAEAGVERLDDEEYPDSDVYHYLGSANAGGPEGATAARIRRIVYACTVEVLWYGPATETEEAAAIAAARERREELEAARKASHEKRLAFLAGYFARPVREVGSQALRQLAERAWEDENGLAEELESIETFIDRVRAAALDDMENETTWALQQADGWYGKQYGARTVSYLTAMQGCGYELDELENAALSTIKKRLAERADEDDAAEDEDGDDD